MGNKLSGLLAIIAISAGVGFWQENHLTLLVIIFVCSVIGLANTIQPGIGNINVYLDADIRALMKPIHVPAKFVIQLDREIGRERIISELFDRIAHKVGNGQFPLTFNVGGHKITVVVDGCADGVPSYMRSAGELKGGERDSGSNAGSGFKLQ